MGYNRDMIGIRALNTGHSTLNLTFISPSCHITSFFGMEWGTVSLKKCDVMVVLGKKSQVYLHQAVSERLGRWAVQEGGWLAVLLQPARRGSEAGLKFDGGAFSTWGINADATVRNSSAQLIISTWLQSKTRFYDSSISHQSYLWVNNPHDHLGLQQSIGQLRVLQQHVPRLLRAVLHTQLDREIRSMIFWTTHTHTA